MLIYGFDQSSDDNDNTTLLTHALTEIDAHFTADEECATMLSEGIVAAKDAMLDQTNAFKLLERLRTGIESLVRQRRLALLSKPDSLTSKRQQSQDTIILQAQLAVAYTSLFANQQVAEREGALGQEVVQSVPEIAASKSKGNLQTVTDTPMLPVAMHRAMCLWTNLLKWHFQLFYGAPQGLWRNLHYIYAHVQAQGVEHFAPLQTNTVAEKLTLGNCYKRALLLDAANTSCMQAQDMEVLYTLLPEWTEQVELRGLGNKADLYYIDLASDKGTVYQSLQTENSLQKPFAWRSLDTTELSVELTALCNRANADGELKLGDFTLHHRMLQQLKSTLSGKPMRKYRRLGSGQQQGQAYLALLDVKTLEQQQAQVWDVINTSAEGYCLAQKGQNLPLLAVGQMLRIHEANADSHPGEEGALAIIRWLNHDKNDELHMGIQLLSPLAVRLSAKLGERLVPILRLPELNALNRGPSVIIAKALASKGSVLELPDGRATLKFPIESGPEFAQYEFIFDE